MYFIVVVILPSSDLTVQTMLFQNSNSGIALVISLGSPENAAHVKPQIPFPPANTSKLDLAIFLSF